MVAKKSPKPAATKAKKSATRTGLSRKKASVSPKSASKSVKKTTKKPAAKKIVKKAAPAKKKASAKKAVPAKKKTVAKKATPAKQKVVAKKAVPAKKKAKLVVKQSAAAKKRAAAAKRKARAADASSREAAAAKKKLDARRKVQLAAKQAAGVPANPSPTRKVPKGKAKKLGKRDSEMMRKMLIELRQRLSQQVSILKDESLYRSDEIRTGEEGTDVFDRQFALNLASSEQEAIHDIDDAIRRIDEGTYGVCEDCGCVIGKARLKALPFVRSCMQCQSEKERNRPHFRPFV